MVVDRGWPARTWERGNRQRLGPDSSGLTSVAPVDIITLLVAALLCSRLRVQALWEEGDEG
jgi:hypothetical protein